MPHLANPNEATMISSEESDLLVNDMKTASTAVLLKTAEDVVADRMAKSQTLDLAAEERAPKFDIRDLNLGRVVGRGGFCTVHEVRGIRGLSICSGDTAGTLSTMSRFFSNSLRRQDVASMQSSTGSDWASNSEYGTNNGPDAVVDIDNAGPGPAQRGPKKYVLKRVSSDHSSKITFLKGTVDLAMETKFLANLDHKNIIKLYGVSSDGPFAEGYFLILERVKETLTKRIKKWMDVERQCKGITGVFTGSKRKMQMLAFERISASFHIAKAMEYLHQRNIMFRDLKPDNVGFNRNGDLKLFDFGLAKELSDDERTQDGTYKMTGVTGALRYMAPEVGLRKPYNLSADVYSWTMVLWYILALEPPFGLYTEKMITERVFENEYRPKIFTRWSPRIAAIINQGWQRDLKTRPTFTKVVEVMKEELSEINP